MLIYLSVTFLTKKAEMNLCSQNVITFSPLGRMGHVQQNGTTAMTSMKEYISNTGLYELTTLVSVKV